MTTLEIDLSGNLVIAFGSVKLSRESCQLTNRIRMAADWCILQSKIESLDIEFDTITQQNCKSNINRLGTYGEYQN